MTLNLVAKRQGCADVLGDARLADIFPSVRQRTGNGEVIKTGNDRQEEDQNKFIRPHTALPLPIVVLWCLTKPLRNRTPSQITSSCTLFFFHAD